MYSTSHRFVIALALVPAMAMAADVPELAKAATEDAGTVDAQGWELSVGAATTWSDRVWDDTGTSADRGGTSRENGLELGLKYGVVENLDVGIAVGWSSVSDKAVADDEPDSGSGLTDLDLGAKWRFLTTEDDHFAMAVTAGAIAPMGRGTDEEKKIPVASEDWSLRGGVVATGWIEQFAYSTALELVRPLGEAADETRYEIAWDAALGVQVLPWLQPEIELHYQTAKAVEGDDASVWSGTIGLLASLESGRIAVAWTSDLAGQSADQSDQIAASYTVSF